MDGTNDHKKKVLEAALSLFIDHGYHGRSIKLIVEESGVSTGSVYHHFSNKEDIIKELYAVTKKHMNASVLDNVDMDAGIRLILRDYWYARIDYTMTFSRKAKFISTYFNAKLVQSEHLQVINSMYDLFNACDAVSLYFDTMDLASDKAFIETAFRKYWRSIVNMII